MTDIENDSYYNHSIREIHARKYEDSETLTSQITSSFSESATSSVIAKKKQEILNDDDIDDFSLESERFEMKVMYTPWNDLKQKNDDSVSDPVFSIVESTTDDESVNSFQKAWTGNKTKDDDDDDFDTLFAKWCEGKISNLEFNKLLKNMKDEESLFLASTVYSNEKEKHEDLLAEEEDESPENDAADEKPHYLLHNSEEEYSSKSKNDHLQPIDEKSAASSYHTCFEIEPIIHDDVSSIGQSLPSTNPYSDPYAQAAIAIEKEHRIRSIKSDSVDAIHYLPNQLHVEPNEQRHSNDHNVESEEKKHVKELLEESFELSELEDTSSNNNIAEASKMISELKKMYKQMFDDMSKKSNASKHPIIEEIEVKKKEPDDAVASISKLIAEVKAEIKSVYTEMSKEGDERLEDFVSKNSSILESIKEEDEDDLESVHAVKEIRFFKSDDEELGICQCQSDLHKCPRPHTIDGKKSIWKKRCSAACILLLLLGLGLGVWYILKMHHDNARPAKFSYLV